MSTATTLRPLSFAGIPLRSWAFGIRIWIAMVVALAAAFWLRLAQRVPVRIAIDSMPRGIPLVSGMTAKVSVKDADASEDGSWLGRTVAELATRLSDLLDGPARTHSGRDHGAGGDGVPTG